MDCPTLRRASCSFAPFSIRSISFRNNVTDPSSSIYFLAVNWYAYKTSGIVSKSENHILSLVRFTNLGFSWITLFRKHSALSLPSEPVPLTYLPSPPYPHYSKSVHFVNCVHFIPANNEPSNRADAVIWFYGTILFLYKKILCQGKRPYRPHAPCHVNRPVLLNLNG